MSIVTIGDFKNYLQTVANAVSSGKMNVNDAEVKSVLQTIAAAVGEVSATPTANTLADRLKAIADRLGEASANPTANTALARLKALEGYLDGVEAALGAQADAEATGNGSLIAIVKRLRTILTDVWNDAANALNVQLTGSNVQDSQAIPTKRTSKVEIVTLVNAVSVNPGEYTSPASINSAGASEVYILVNIDKQPWSLTGGVIWYPLASYNSLDVFYPKRAGVTTTYAVGGNPCVSLFLGANVSSTTGLLSPASWADAKAVQLPPAGGEQIRVRNESAEVATVTIRIMRVWR